MSPAASQDENTVVALGTLSFTLVRDSSEGLPAPYKRVPRPVLGDPKGVSNHIYVTGGLIYIRVRSLLTCVMPKHKRVTIFAC